MAGVPEADGMVPRKAHAFANLFAEIQEEAVEVLVGIVVRVVPGIAEEEHRRGVVVF